MPLALAKCKILPWDQKIRKVWKILEHFSYPGHLRSSKTKKIRGVKGGGGGQNSRIYSVLLLHTVNEIKLKINTQYPNEYSSPEVEMTSSVGSKAYRGELR